MLFSTNNLLGYFKINGAGGNRLLGEPPVLSTMEIFGGLDYDYGLYGHNTINPEDWAFKFDGIDGYARLINSVETTLNEVTVAFYMSANTPSVSKKTLFKITDGTEDRCIISLVSDSPESRSIAVQPKLTDTEYTTSYKLRTEAFYHISASFSGSGWTLYIDGIEVLSGSESIDAITSFTEYDFGQRVSSDPSSDFFDGLMDNIAIYRRALDHNEILEIYQDTKAESYDPDILAAYYYRMTIGGLQIVKNNTLHTVKIYKGDYEDDNYYLLENDGDYINLKSTLLPRDIMIEIDKPGTPGYPKKVRRPSTFFKSEKCCILRYDQFEYTDIVNKAYINENMLTSIIYSNEDIGDRNPYVYPMKDPEYDTDFTGDEYISYLNDELQYPTGNDFHYVDAVKKTDSNTVGFVATYLVGMGTEPSTIGDDNYIAESGVNILYSLKYYYKKNNDTSYEMILEDYGLNYFVKGDDPVGVPPLFSGMNYDTSLGNILRARFLSNSYTYSPTNDVTPKLEVYGQSMVLGDEDDQNRIYERIYHSSPNYDTQYSNTGFPIVANDFFIDEEYSSFPATSGSDMDVNLCFTKNINGAVLFSEPGKDSSGNYLDYLYDNNFVYSHPNKRIELSDYDSHFIQINSLGLDVDIVNNGGVLLDVPDDYKHSSFDLSKIGINGETDVLIRIPAKAELTDYGIVTLSDEEVLKDIKDRLLLSIDRTIVDPSDGFSFKNTYIYIYEINDSNTFFDETTESYYVRIDASDFPYNIEKEEGASLVDKENFSFYSAYLISKIDEGFDSNHRNEIISDYYSVDPTTKFGNYLQLATDSDVSLFSHEITPYRIFDMRDSAPEIAAKLFYVETLPKINISAGITTKFYLFQFENMNSYINYVIWDSLYAYITIHHKDGTSTDLIELWDAGLEYENGAKEYNIITSSVPSPLSPTPSSNGRDMLINLKLRNPNPMSYLPSFQYDYSYDSIDISSFNEWWDSSVAVFTSPYIRKGVGENDSYIGAGGKEIQRITFSLTSKQLVPEEGNVVEITLTEKEINTNTIIQEYPIYNNQEYLLEHSLSNSMDVYLVANSLGEYSSTYGSRRDIKSNMVSQYNFISYYSDQDVYKDSIGGSANLRIQNFQHLADYSMGVIPNSISQLFKDKPLKISIPTFDELAPTESGYNNARASTNIINMIEVKFTSPNKIASMTIDRSRNSILLKEESTIKINPSSNQIKYYGDTSYRDDSFNRKSIDDTFYIVFGGVFGLRDADFEQGTISWFAYVSKNDTSEIQILDNSNIIPNPLPENIVAGLMGEEAVSDSFSANEIDVELINLTVVSLYQFKRDSRFDNLAVSSPEWYWISHYTDCNEIMRSMVGRPPQLTRYMIEDLAVDTIRDEYNSRYSLVSNNPSISTAMNYFDFKESNSYNQFNNLELGSFFQGMGGREYIYGQFLRYFERAALDGGMSMGSLATYLIPNLDRLYCKEINYGYEESKNKLLSKTLIETNKKNKEYEFDLYIQSGKVNHLAIPINLNDYGGYPGSVYIHNGYDVSSDRCNNILVIYLKDMVGDPETYSKIEKIKDYSWYKMSEPIIKSGDLCIFGNEVVEIKDVSGEHLVTGSLDDLFPKEEPYNPTNDYARLIGKGIDPKLYQYKIYNIDYEMSRSTRKYGFQQTLHDVVEPIRSVSKISQLVKSLNVGQNIISHTSNPFTPTSSMGNIEIDDDVMNWSRFNPSRKYNVLSNSAVYLFEGDKDMKICTYVGYASEVNTDLYNNTISISTQDLITAIQDRKIKNVKSLSNVNACNVVEEAISNEFVPYVRLATGTSGRINNNDIPILPYFNTGMLGTYKDLYSFMGSLGIRMWFDTLERVVMDFPILEKQNPPTYANDITELNSANDFIQKEFQLLTGEDLLYNKILINFENNFPLYNSRDFKDANGKMYGITDINKEDTNYISISKFMMYKKIDTYYFNLITESITIKEFEAMRASFNDPVIMVSKFDPNIVIGGKLVDAKLDPFDDEKMYITVSCGTDYNFQDYHLGYLEHLYNEYFSDSSGDPIKADFELLISPNILPILYQKAVDRNGDSNESSLRISLMPQEEREWYVKLGSANAEGIESTDIVDSLDQYYGIYTGDNFQLPFGREVYQNKYKDKYVIDEEE